MNAMKRALLCIFLIFNLLKVFAQPVAEYANVQLIQNYKLYGASVASIGNPGANVVLDLSQVQFTSMNITANFTADCSSTPYFMNYQNSNICAINGDYNYLILDKDSLVKVGQENSISSTKYSDPEVLVVFPMQYLDTHVDKFKSLDGENDGGVTLKYEAYGTLKTQFGVVDNVITIQRGQYHEFWTSKPFRNLAQWDASKKIFYYYDVQTTGIPTIGKNVNTIYPTLVTDNLYFSNKSDLKSIQIINSGGQLILSKKMISEVLDVSALIKGLYLVTVQVNGETLHSRIIKQ